MEPQKQQTNVQITLDGKKLEVPAGWTVMQAADQAGVFIPRYCYHPGLSIAANCRICLVQVEKAPRLLPACATYVQDTMEISTQNEKVLEARRQVLEFLLLNHPVDCPVCDQAGECGLQEYYMRFGRYQKRYLEPRIRRRKAKPIGPHVILDQERCILCTRCIRFNEEIAGHPQLGLFQRGNRTVIDIFPGQPLDHPYSGCTVDVCPVGALLDRDFRFRARVWFLKQTPSVCPGCSTGCNIYIHWNEDKPYLDKGRRVFRLKPRFNPNVNQYWMCDEGRYDYKWIDENRIDRPYRRHEDRWEPVTWDEALSTLAPMFQDYGTESFAVLLSPHLTLEELYLGWKLFVKTLTIPHINARMPSRASTSDSFLIRPDKYPNGRGVEILGIGQNSPDAESILHNAAEGRYRLLWMVGWNPPRYFSRELLQQVQKNTEVLVLQTTNFGPGTQGFGWLLPAASYAEKDGTFINFQNRIQRIFPAIQPYRESLPDRVIFCKLAQALGLEGWDYRDAESVFREICEQIPAFSGLSYEKIGLQGEVLEFHPQTAVRASERSP